MAKNKGLLLIIIIICSIICVSTVNAENITFTKQNETPDDVIIYEELNGTEEVNRSNCECCSILIQENDETVYAFRQDGQLNGHGIEINPQSWYGMNILKQEIDTPYEYFFHGIITEHGWVVSEGGSQYNDSSRRIEQLAAEMINNNHISPSCLNEIKNILSRYKYGHFAIKSPNGNYGLAFSNTYLTGTLQSGQCLVVPNYYSSYYKVNYKRYSSNPVNAAIIICSYESSGYNRKSIITYDYKTHDTENGVYYGIDAFATNDNGRNVGLNTANKITHIYFKGKYFAPGSIPQNPNSIYLGSQIFESRKLSPVITLVNGKYNGLVKEQIDLHYQVKHLVSERTAVFNLDKNFEFIKAETSQGTFTYNKDQNTIYWKVPAIKNARNIIISLIPKVTGDYNIHSYIQDMNEYHDKNYHASDYGAIITANDIDKYKGGTQNLNVRLTDKLFKPIIGEKVSITINGKTYTRETKTNGYAVMNINLVSGEYKAIVKYDGKFGKNQTTSEIMVKTTVFGEDIVKYYKNGTQFYASFLDGEGKALKNSNVNFNINGVFYTRTTDENGFAKLNINLPPNRYVITSINTATGEQKSNKIIVKPVLVENKDLIKYFMDESKYTVKLLDGTGKYIEGKSITFNINGVFYKRNTDENGTAKLNINLAPGKYIITAQYDGASVSNNIKILERLITNDLSMKYKDGSEFKVTTLNEKGKISPYENLSFNINGVFYNRTTDSEGIAKLNINLIKGEYIITTYWNKYSKSNKITIS